MKTKFCILIAIIIAFSGFWGCNKDEFKKCSASLLDISCGNYTIEIIENNQYKGIYYVTDGMIKKYASSTNYYYFKGDDN
ncbi:MAG: hypothetical protein IJW82_02035, partial [Clostridia bacterium]|nr:hypothetical protein [Clostridia bacterium]